MPFDSNVGTAGRPVATDSEGNMVYGETEIDTLKQAPQELMLHPNVAPTREAIEAVAEADLILIGPGSFSPV